MKTSEAVGGPFCGRRYKKPPTSRGREALLIGAEDRMLAVYLYNRSTMKWMYVATIASGPEDEVMDKLKELLP